MESAHHHLDYSTGTGDFPCFLFKSLVYKSSFQLNSYKTFVLITSRVLLKKDMPAFLSTASSSLPTFPGRGSCVIFWCAHCLDILYFCIVYEILSC